MESLSSAAPFDLIELRSAGKLKRKEPHEWHSFQLLKSPTDKGPKGKDRCDRKDSLVNFAGCFTAVFHNKLHNLIQMIMKCYKFDIEFIDLI